MYPRLVTVSERRAKAKCDRLHFIRYVLGYRPVKDAVALVFGTLVHAALEAWWDALSDAIFLLRERQLLPADRYDPSMLTAGMKMAILDAALAALAGEPDAYERAKAVAMITAYHARWIGEAIEPLAVEWTLDESPESPGTPVENPFTGDEVVDFRQGGKIDVLVKLYRADGTSGIYVAEHKTATGDVGPGSPYRVRLAGDPQISTYIDSVRALGFPAEGVLYDVLVKPEAPKRATPMESRKYKQARYKQCPECRRKVKAGSAPKALPPHAVELPAEEGQPARTVNCEVGIDEQGIVAESAPRRICTDPGGQLYATMRAEDETPEAYGARLSADIAAEPDAYLVRQEIARLDGELQEHRKDAFTAAVAIVQLEDLYEREQTRPGSVPPQMLYVLRNADACVSYGQTCSFYGACYGSASLDDPQFFKRVTEKHVELAAVVK